MRKLFSLLTAILFAGSMMAGVESVDFSTQGYENQQAVESYTGTNFTVTFDKGTNSNAPKYYTSGTAIRCYGANTFTVASESTISQIVLTYGTGEGSNEITAVPGTFTTDTWTGSANSVVFTIGGTSGNRRIKAIEVTFDGEGGGETPGGDTPGGDTPEVTDPTNCAEAATAALSVSANNELYNGGKSYTIQGYVTEIAFAYDATKGNMSFWMADAADGGNVLEAYKCTITSAENAPEVGDKVAVTGKLTKFNTTPEFAAGCTVAIIEKAGGDTPGGDTPGGDTPASGDAESVDFSAQGYENQQAIESYTGTNFTVIFDKGTNSNAPKYYTSGTAIRCYGANTFTVASTKTIIKIVLTYGASDGSNEITAAPGTFDTNTWTGSANSVVFTIGGTSGNRRIKAIEVTFDGGGDDPVTPPVEMTDAEKLEAYIALLGDVKTYVSQFAGLGVGAEDFVQQVDKLIFFGNQALSSGDATTISAFVAQAEGQINSYVSELLTTGKEGLAKQLDNLLDNAQGCDACVTIVNTLKQTVQGLAWDSNKSNEENLANLANQTEQILKDAQQQIEAALNPGTATDPTNCAEAREAALSVSANNELYNNGKEYTIEGYVTEITYAWKNKSMSFWMADTKNGGNVIQAYKCVVENEADAPKVGDKVKVTGKLTKFNTTPEFAANCTVVIVERAGGGDTPAVTDPTNCAEAAAAALSVSGDNVPYNDSTIYTIQGYVTSIQTAYNPSFGNISFWMADTKDGGKVIEPYRCVPESAEEIPAVGDLVEVKGALSKYKSSPQFMAGCTCRILEKDIPAANLGDKTIAEFLALKNIKDTCVLTGIVANIKKDEDGSYNKYGNFDLVELGNDEVSVYIYGLLTADGQAQKFAEMGVDENDTLVIKAIYSEHNGTPQAANAIFVEVRKAAAAEWEPWDFVKTQYIAYEGDGYVDINLFTNDSYSIEINEEGGQDLYGEGDCTILTLDIAYTDLDDLTGSYSSADQTLDLEYTYAVTFEGDEEEGTTLGFTSGLVTISWNANHDGYVLVYNLTDTYGRFCTDTLDIPLYGDAPTPSGDNVQINIDDATWDADDQGYWLIYGQTDSYLVGLANLTAVEEVDGTYTVAELDPNYSYILDADNNKITLESGSIEIFTEDGSVYVEGTVVGSDGVTYELYLAYETVQPTGEEVTIKASGDDVVYADNVASQGWWIIQGRNADYTVQLSNLSTDIEQAAGTYDNADLDPDYSWVVYNNDTIAFASGSITLAEDRGAIILTGSLLGQDGTLYHLDFMYGEPVDPTGEEVTIKAEGDDVNLYGSADDGYIWVEATSGDYAVSLALIGIEEVSGTYNASDLYASFSFVALNKDTVGFASGSFTMTEYPKGGVLVTGSLLGANGTLYNLELIYGDTTAVDPALGDRIEVTITSGLIWADYTADPQQGWWQIRGSNADYYITLSNAGMVTTAVGTYSADELDKSYSYIKAITDEEEEETPTITFVLGSITVAIDDLGKVTIIGELVGSDNNTYVLNLQYVEPKAETTVEVSIPEGELQDYTDQEEFFGLTGYTADSTVIAQFILDGTSVAGTYTEEDFDVEYFSGLYLKNAAGSYDAVEVYTATITIVDGGNGAYTLTADLLCYNNTLYKVTLSVPAVPTGIEETVAAGKAAKILRNGQIYILKGDKIFNIMGAAIR